MKTNDNFNILFYIILFWEKKEIAFATNAGCGGRVAERLPRAWVGPAQLLQVRGVGKRFWLSS
jgi:hypothetical protein